MIAEINDTHFFWGASMEGMQFDAGTWWLAVLLLSGVTALLFWLLKRSYDRVERKADGAVPKAEFDKQLDDCKAQIQEIQKTYTTRSAHEKDIDECRKKITEISRNYLTREDFFREQAKTDRKLDQILDILMKRGIANE